MSAETKFTRGPWYVIQDDRDGMEWNRHICWDPAGDHRIAFMASDAGTEANAHLIAAAPELYEALDALINAPIIYTGATEEPMVTCGLEMVQPFLNSALAALSKARGEV